MPDATITSSESTFGTISGTFSADQSTVTGTISGVITGTLTGSVGVPGPQGQQGIQGPPGPEGPPGEGGTWGSIVGDIEDQADLWTELGTKYLASNPAGYITSSALSGYATESWVTAGFYPLTGNPSGFLTSSSLTPYLTKADNLGSLTNFATARDNLSLGSLSTPTFAGITAQGSGANVANLTPTSLSLTHATSGSFVIQPSVGITFPDASVQTTAFTTSQLTAYLAKASNLSDLASASSARTNLGLGSLAVVNDAPSDGSQYARKNGAWDVVSAGADFISSVSSPLAVTSGNLTIDLSGYAPAAAGLPDNGVAGQILVKQSSTAYDAEWQDNFATELRMPARNETGATLTKGTVVYISGGAGNKPLLSKALATGDSTSAQTIGLVTADIPHNSNGDVTIRGQLKNLDTSAFSVGAQLYLSGTTAGAFTATKTLAPTHLVYVGIVVRSNTTEGAIEVAVQNGYELDELHDVAIASKANNDLLAYESSTNLWKNKTYSALGLLTSADAAATYAAKSGATFTGDVLVSASPDLSTLSAGLLALTGSGSTNGLTLSTIAGYPQIYFNGPTGTSTQTVAYPGPSGFLLKADNLSGLASTATARANLGLGTMATATASDYSTTSVANGLYYPLSSNPAGYLTSAPVTSVAGRTGAVTLSTSDISGLGTLATVNDAPSDGNQYARKNGAWDIVSVPSSYITSVSSPLSVSSGNLTIDLLAYLTSATAASTYQTISGMSSYLTTSTAASTYQTISGMSSYLTTSAAASTYLTQSNAASTYQTLSGMSSYLTTSSAASTYQTQAGMSDYLSKAGNLAGLANTATARTNLGLGTMATATAADYSTTTAANGLYYPLSSNPAGYLTTAPVTSVAGRTGAVTLAVADVSGAAPTASPALSGTPTAPTATAGTNTTQIATTAFVAAAIPTNNVKAWVNFNGTGTVAIRASMNVTSITDNGTGDYTMNFTAAMTDANYAAAGFAGQQEFSIAVTTSSWGTYTQTTSAFRFKVSYGSTVIDTANVHMTIHR
jgi:hypothetical protein